MWGDHWIKIGWRNLKVTIVDYNPSWPQRFEAEKALIIEKIGQFDPQIEHVGSTSVPGLAAKPVIDIMIGLETLDQAAHCIQPLTNLGYQYVPEFEIELPQRRYFRKLDPAGSKSTHHIHMVATSSGFWERLLIFRDYLRAHPETAAEYEALKRDLASRLPKAEYTDAKTDFVTTIEAWGRQWKMLQEQIEYYRARAPEYDEWFYREGRYHHSQEMTRQWFNEVRQLREKLHDLAPLGEVLELACGTGIWTAELVKSASQITAVDASMETIAINREKHLDAPVTFVEADIFSWHPDRHYDTVFFAFWLSHVPPEKLDSFLAMVCRALKPGGRLFLIDSRRDQTSTARDHEAYQPESHFHTRKLNDGREFKIVKRFYDPVELAETLSGYGFEAEVNVTENYFIYGDGILS